MKKQKFDREESYTAETVRHMSSSELLRRRSTWTYELSIADDRVAALYQELAAAKKEQRLAISRLKGLDSVIARR